MGEIKNKKIGLALGGGGARGLAHIGALKVLVEEGIRFDMISGCSMGAFIAAYYALGLDLEKLEKEVSGYTKSKAIKKLLDLGLPREAILKGEKSKKYIKELIGEKVVFGQTKIPLYIITTDLSTGEEVVLKKGNISEAIMASISVPGIFPPVKLDGKYLIDGGVVNPTPIDTVINGGADVVIGVDLVMKREVDIKNPNLVTTLLQSYEIIRTQAVKFNLSKVGKNTLIIKPKMRGTIDSFKFYDIDKFIKAGEVATREALPEIKKLIK
jgi:NTE family protein